MPHPRISKTPQARVQASPAALARADFEHHGYCFAPRLLPRPLVDQACRRMDAVISGEYDTGIAPFHTRFQGDGTALHKVDQVHLSDPVLRAVCTHPAIGAWAALVSGAQRIQLWAVQMLFKAPGGGDPGAIGFHQDRWYWQYWSEDSEVFTAWVALSDITEDSGPMRFVPRSHTWGALQQPAAAAFSGTGILQPGQIPGVPQDAGISEVPALLEAGAVSFHHRLLVHGSGANRSLLPRRALALHLRTERSQPLAGAHDYYVSHLEDPAYCPVIYEGMSPVAP
jgi:ectoine hydroxylase-related dioxygenase (phytanoyl-CoA dioxygenase family)